jgi:hypothetical protein
MHEPCCSQRTSHEVPPQVTLPAQLFSAPQMTTQLLEPRQSTPLEHEPGAVQSTWHGTPSGHSICDVHGASSSQVIVHTAPWQVPMPAQAFSQSAAVAGGLPPLLVAPAIAAPALPPAPGPPALLLAPPVGPAPPLEPPLLGLSVESAKMLRSSGAPQADAQTTMTPAHQARRPPNCPWTIADRV